MAKVYERIEPRLGRWIGEQPVFFVGTAPLSGDGLVNVSPKGLRGTFGVLDDHTFGEGDREVLDSWAERRSPEWLRRYRAEKNQHSIDGLPGLADLPEW